MAFFDNVKSKLTATSQTAVQKTKDLTAVTRLNAQINETENKINDLYYKLGFEIYRAYRDEPLEEGAELIAQISDLHQEIAGCKAQIMAINHASLCPNCGAKVSKGMVFCSKCGSKLPAEEAPAEETAQARTCPGCGNEVADDVSFCTNCGTPLTEEE